MYQTSEGSRPSADKLLEAPFQPTVWRQAVLVQFPQILWTYAFHSHVSKAQLNQLNFI